MDRDELSSLYTQFLVAEGYRPSHDKDGDIVFKREGKSYVIFVDAEDPSFFRLVFPNFWPIESEEERARVYRAASATSGHTKTVKIYTVEDNVWASVELFVRDPLDVPALFERCLGALQTGVQTFVSVMKS